MEPQLNPDAFKKRIVDKYPDGVGSDGVRYADMDATALTKKVVAKYPNGVTNDGHMYSSFLPKETEVAQKPDTLLKKAGRVAGSVYNTIASPFVGLAAAPVQMAAKALGVEDPYKKGLPSIAGENTRVSELGVKEKAGDLAQVGSYFVPGSGVKALATAGALQGAGSAASEGKDATEIATRGAFGGVIGGALGGIATAATKAPKLLSYSSDVPEEAFHTMLNRPEAFKAATKSVGKGVDALKIAQGAEKALRKQLSADWDTSVASLVDEFQGSRIGFGGDLGKNLIKISDEYGVVLPQNLNNVSVKEAVDLVKSINELPKTMLSLSPRGAIVRRTKAELQKKIIDTFGGEAGSVSKLWKNYSAKKAVFDAADDLLRAYKTGKPITQTTARNRLMGIFNEGKEAYLAAIRELEDATGIDILSHIAATKFSQRMPSGTNTVSFAGGLASPKGSIEKLIDLLAFPITSPSSAGFIARRLNNKALQKGTVGVTGLLGRTGLPTTSLLGQTGGQ